MHQVKLFKGVENEIHGLEAEINAWLKESGAKVVQMLGNIAPQTPGREQGGSTSRFAPSDLFLAVVYEA
ncbi:MAG: hypothetical protein KDA25_08810 [Phycisphaerales bacterium]|nr:hypothetical protein [Phycisphaerales bacterium]